MSLVDSNQSKRLFRKVCGSTARKDAKARFPKEGSVDASAHEGLRVIVVGNTLLYRHLGQTQVLPGDRAIEIGCSYGHCTALFKCAAAQGVDHAAEKIEAARKSYPSCSFACGDIFADDLSCLDSDASVLFLDIGGGRNYKLVTKALAICMPLLPDLRLVVAKSIETRNFLLRFEDAATTVARDLSVSKDDDAEAAQELAVELCRRGGEMPVNLLQLLRCGPRLRYLIGKDRIVAFLKGQAPVLRLREVDFGEPARRLRVSASPRPLPPVQTASVEAARRGLTRRIYGQMRSGETFSFLGVFSRLPRSIFKKFLAITADPELHQQCSEIESWSHDWQSAVAMRHFHAFIVSSPDFVIDGQPAGEVATVDELRGFKLRYVGEPPAEAQEEDELELQGDEQVAATDGPKSILQVMDCDWRSGADDVPEVQDLIVEAAWLLVGGLVVERLKREVGTEKQVADTRQDELLS